MKQEAAQIKASLVNIDVASLKHLVRLNDDEDDAAIRYWMQDINGGCAVRNRIARKFSELHSFDLAQKPCGTPSSHRPNLGNAKRHIVPPTGCFALLGSLNVVNRAARVMTSSKVSNAVLERRRVRRLKEQLNLLFVDAKKSGFVVQTTQEDNQLLDYDFGFKAPNPQLLSHYRNLQLAWARQLVGDGGEGIIET